MNMASRSLPRQTAAFRSAPLRHSDSLPLHSPRGSFRRRSLSDGATKRSKRVRFVMPNVVPACSLSAATAAMEQQLSSHVEEETPATIRHDEHGNWVVTSDMLEPVPKYYPLEQSTLRIHNVPATEIAQRITKFMKRNSIACRYHKTRVNCTSPKLCRFAINLWKSSPNATIVELQRLQGNCMEMRKIHKELFEAIESGIVETPMQSDDHRVSLFMKQAFDEEQQNDSKTRASVNDSIRIAQELLSSHYLDQNRLGMESLLVLVDSAIVGHDCALRVSREALCNNPILRVALKSHLHQDNTEQPLEEAYYSDSDAEEYAQHGHYTDMHNLALQVFAKALTMLSMTETRLPSPLYHNVLESLVHDISMAQYFPQEAALSAMIVALLLEMDATTVTANYKTSLLPILYEALEYGKWHHAQLETETKRLLERLNQ